MKEGIKAEKEASAQPRCRHELTGAKNPAASACLGDRVQQSRTRPERTGPARQAQCPRSRRARYGFMRLLMSSPATRRRRAGGFVEEKAKIVDSPRSTLVLVVRKVDCTPAHRR